MKKLLIIGLAVIIVVISILFIWNNYFNRAVCIEWVDFIKFNDISYDKNYYFDEALTKDDLGEQYSTIKFKVSDNIFRSNYKSKNGDAAYLSKGTPIYKVKGYSPNFRLAAVVNKEIIIYEADRNPKAKRGRDLLDIEGKVEYIGINSEEDGVTELFSIKDKKTVDNMVSIVLNTPIKYVKDLVYNTRYFIAFHLNDGTKVTRCYFVEPNYLQGGLKLPHEFKQIIEETQKDKIIDEKPIIYLYPEKEQTVSVKLHYHGELFCTYPNYNDGWNVIAKPDGTLINKADNKEYSYLFWEGINDKDNWDLSSGFVIKGEDTVEFLQDKLSYMGLTPKEYNEFIVYWLPKMQNNKYNLIHFAGKEYEESAKLNITPKPDSILRVFMVFKPLNKYMEIEEQQLKSFNRTGFTVIEWGGTELN